jgi:hypothetical protein
MTDRHRGERRPDKDQGREHRCRQAGGGPCPQHRFEAVQQRTGANPTQHRHGHQRHVVIAADGGIDIAQREGPADDEPGEQHERQLWAAAGCDEHAG